MAAFLLCIHVRRNCLSSNSAANAIHWRTSRRDVGHFDWRVLFFCPSPTAMATTFPCSCPSPGPAMPIPMSAC